VDREGKRKHWKQYEEHWKQHEDGEAEGIEMVDKEEMAEGELFEESKVEMVAEENGA
jgi:hypothetical protein